MCQTRIRTQAGLGDGAETSLGTISIESIGNLSGLEGNHQHLEQVRSVRFFI